MAKHYNLTYTLNTNITHIGLPHPLNTAQINTALMLIHKTPKAQNLNFIVFLLDTPTKEAYNR